MDEQAFQLLRDQLTDIKADIDELKGEIRGYQRANNDIVTKLRVNVAKLMVITGLVGFTSGGIGSAVKDKVLPPPKSIERIKIIKKQEPNGEE
jgi:hypothetical protein